MDCRRGRGEVERPRRPARIFCFHEFAGAIGCAGIKGRARRRRILQFARVLAALRAAPASFRTP